MTKALEKIVSNMVGKDFIIYCFELLFILTGSEIRVWTLYNKLDFVPIDISSHFASNLRVNGTSQITHEINYSKNIFTNSAFLRCWEVLAELLLRLLTQTEWLLKMHILLYECAYTGRKKKKKVQHFNINVQHSLSLNSGDIPRTPMKINMQSHYSSKTDSSRNNILGRHPPY